VCRPDRVEVIGADDAIALVDRAEIEDGPTLVALLWFERHKDRLRRVWRAITNASGKPSAGS
jgi:hypothetical protein